MGVSHNSISILEMALPTLLSHTLGEWEEGHDQVAESNAFKAYIRSIREICVLLWGCSQAAQVSMLLRGIFPISTGLVLNAGWKILLSSLWRHQLVTKCFTLISTSQFCPVHLGSRVMANPQVETDALRVYMNQILEPPVSLFRFVP
jgi:hypothetical protein